MFKQTVQVYVNAKFCGDVSLTTAGCGDGNERGLLSLHRPVISHAF